MKLKNNDPGKIWAKVDNQFKKVMTKNSISMGIEYLKQLPGYGWPEFVDYTRAGNGYLAQAYAAVILFETRSVYLPTSVVRG